MRKILILNVALFGLLNFAQAACNEQLAFDSVMSADMLTDFPGAVKTNLDQNLNVEKREQLTKNGSIQFVLDDNGKQLFEYVGGRYKGSVHVKTTGVNINQVFGLPNGAPGPINKPQEWNSDGIGLPFVQDGSKVDFDLNRTLLRTRVDIPLGPKLNYQIQMLTERSGLVNGKLNIAQSWFLNKMVQFSKSSCSSPMVMNQGSWFLVQNTKPLELYVRYNVEVDIINAVNVGDYLMKQQLVGLVEKMLSGACPKDRKNCWAK